MKKKRKGRNQKNRGKKRKLKHRKRSKNNTQKKLLTFFKKSNFSEVKQVINQKKAVAKHQNSSDILNTLKENNMGQKIENLISDFKNLCLKLQKENSYKSKNKCIDFVNKPRRKDIFIEGSHKKYTCIWLKSSNIICGRNPFKTDESVIDYDMDSEDELEEENGEDIVDEKEDEDEEMVEEEEEEGFIVPDGYLSQSEKNDDHLELGEVDPKETRVGYTKMKKERQLNTIMQPIVSIFSEQTMAAFEPYKIITAKTQIKFPLIISAKDFDEPSDEDEKKDRNDPNAINLKMKEFVLMVHGSYEAK